MNATHNAYVRELIWAYRAEVFGQALYATAEHFTRQPNRHAKWQLLAELETKTKALLAEALNREGVSPPQLGFPWLLGQIMGVFAAVFPWRLIVWIIGVTARSTMARFERFGREIPNTTADIARHLIAHERAQYEFAIRELDGDPARSLDPVLALLRRTDQLAGRDLSRKV